MRDIVATIQREQDEAIRAPARGVTVIGGGPGTGKTAVALHRAAYLLYSDRRRFERGGVLVVGPSAAFMAYIERVLPCLGENTASLRAVGELVDGVRPPRSTRPRWPRSRARCGCAACCRGPRATACRRAPTTLRVFIGGATVELDANQLDNVRRNALRRTPRNEAGAEARKASGRPRCGSRFPDDLRTGVYGDREAFGDQLTDTPAFRTFFEPWWPVLTPEAVLRWLGDPRRLQRWARNGFSPAEIDALARAIRGTDELTIADVALLDELGTLLGRPPVTAGQGRGVRLAGGSVATASTRCCTTVGAPGPGRGGPGGRRAGSTRTCWSTRRRTSRRCSGGWSAGAGRRRAGRSSATRRRARGRDPDEARAAMDRCCRTCSGTRSG